MMPIYKSQGNRNGGRVRGNLSLQNVYNKLNISKKKRKNHKRADRDKNSHIKKKSGDYTEKRGFTDMIFVKKFTPAQFHKF